MKHLSKTEKKRLESSLNTIEAKLARRKRRKSYSKERKLNKKRRKSKKWWTRNIEAPVSFKLSTREEHTALMEFIEDIFSRSEPNQVLRLDFKYTEVMMVDALLIFVANLTKAIKLKDVFQRIRVAPSDNKLINAVLTKVGVLDLCGQDFHINPEKESGVIDWKGLSGSTLDKFDPIELHKFLSSGLGHSPPKVLGSAVNEALLNIKHHAFDKSEGGTWWLLIHKNEATKTCFIVVCDLGMGIPVSIKVGEKENQKHAQKLINRLKSLSKREIPDSQLIRISMRLGHSRTGKTYRGKGLPAMKNVVEKISDQNSVLSIYSNNGRYTKIADMKNSHLEEYSHSIGGTVVGWKIPLNIDEIIKV